VVVYVGWRAARSRCHPTKLTISGHRARCPSACRAVSSRLVDRRRSQQGLRHSPRGQPVSAFGISGSRPGCSVSRAPSMALVHWQAAVRRHERWAHEFIEQALWPLIRDVLHLRQPRGIVRIAAFAKGFSRATSSGARLQIAAPGAAAGSAMRVQV